jgi:NTP pyrophosphatase (non-canonical NTP hydrolase)
MSTADLQQLVAEFVAANGLSAEVEARLLDLHAEVGELAKEWLKASEYGKGEFAAGDAWAEEMGDVFFSLLALAESSGVDLEAALRVALKKYAQRVRQRGDAGSVNS